MELVSLYSSFSTGFFAFKFFSKVGEFVIMTKRMELEESIEIVTMPCIALEAWHEILVYTYY